MTPNWLPPEHLFSASHNNREFFIDDIYSIFIATVCTNPPLYYAGKPVYVDNTCLTDGKHERFWHVITDPHSAHLANIKIPRAQKVPWIHAIIQNAHMPDVCVYSKPVGRSMRVHLFVPTADFIVILEETKRAYYFVTAYHIDYSYKKRKYEREYLRYTQTP